MAPFLKNHTVLLLIVLLAAAVRLYKIDNPLYDWNTWRQTETAAIAMNYYQDHLPFLYPEIDWVGEHGHAEMEFPIFPYLISWLYYVTFPWDGWGRILTLIFSLGVVCVVYDIGRQLSSRTMGLFAAACFAASPLGIYYGRAFMPDMTMVFFATLSVALMLRWQPSDPKWLYAAAYSLAVGVLMKPPCLMVSFPILLILHQRLGWRFLMSKDVWMAMLIVFVPSAMWYTHAHSFFEESQASFIRHFKDQGFIEYVAANLQWQNLYVILFERISLNILALVGWIPLLIGLVRLFYPHQNRLCLIFWLIATFIFYAVIAAHHRGHDYYSLLPIVSLSLVCGFGCEWVYHRIKSPARMVVWVLPLFMLIAGFYGLLRFDAYRQWYAYYQDALAMKTRISKDSLILVMDEILHTPEFFYFIDRNGWHRFREPGENVVDADWLEQHRSLGADYYLGMNEAVGNHPLSYLQIHPMGQYIYTHYQIEYIGARFFIANLNQPFSDEQIIKQHESNIITTPAVIQAEQLLSLQSTLMHDPTADRQTALFSQTDDAARIMTYGPYFHFPAGVYEFDFRLRALPDMNSGAVEIGLRYDDEFLASRRISVAEELSEDYKHFTLTQSIAEDQPLETRVMLEPNTAILFDTVTIRHLQSGVTNNLSGQSITHLLVVENQIVKVTQDGKLFTLNDEPSGQITNGVDMVVSAHWDQSDGYIWLNNQHTFYDGVRTPLITIQTLLEDELPVSISRNSGTLTLLTNQHHILVWSQLGQQVMDIPQTTAPPRDIAVTANGEIYVLYGSGNINTVPGGAVQTSIPVVGTDVYRRLIPHQNGFYVVDALGAIHNTEDIPPVRSPYYKAEDWIIDAERSPSGQWAFLTKEGKVLTFEE